MVNEETVQSKEGADPRISDPNNHPNEAPQAPQMSLPLIREST